MHTPAICCAKLNGRQIAAIISINSSLAPTYILTHLSLSISLYWMTLIHSLPIPWLLYGIIFQAPVEVNSCGMICSIAILFMMLLFVIASIACFRWKMNKGLGITMFFLYFAFVAVSLMFEYKHLTCPF